MSGNWDSESEGLTGWYYYGSNGFPTKTAIWFEEYVSQHKSEGVKDIFTTCFGRTKGVLSVGDLDSSLSTGSIHYADIQSGSFYTLHLNDIRMDGNSLASVVASLRNDA